MYSNDNKSIDFTRKKLLAMAKQNVLADIYKIFNDSDKLNT